MPPATPQTGLYRHQDKEKEINVIHHCVRVARPMAARLGEQLHDGGFIHLLLLIALVVIVVRLLQGRRVS